MKRPSAEGLLVAFAIVLGAMLIAKVQNGGNPSAPVNIGGAVISASREAQDPRGGVLQNLASKSTLGVIKGIKTTAPIVPAPVIRTLNKIVEYDLTVRETSATIAPDLTYLSLWTFDGLVPGPVMRVKVAT